MSFISPECTCILSASSVNISRQTFLERLDAQRTNILVSAEVWLQNNTIHFGDKQPGYTLELDTDTLNIPNSSCTITLTEHTNDSAIILITAQILHGQKQFTKNNEVKIELKN